MIHSPVSEQKCCTLPLIQIIFHWSLQERDFLTFSSSPKWSQWGFSSFPSPWQNAQKKVIRLFFFFFSQSDFLLFFQQLNANALQLKPVRLHHRQTDSLTASSGHTRCCRCSWRVNAPPLSLHTLRDASRCCCGSRVCGAQVRRRTHTGRQEEMERLSKQQIMSSSS